MSATPEDKLAAAVEEWFAETSDVPAVATAFYVVATGPGFEDDGDDSIHVSTYWRGGPVEQVGLLAFATQRANERLFGREDGL